MIDTRRQLGSSTWTGTPSTSLAVGRNDHVTHHARFWARTPDNGARQQRTRRAVLRMLSGHLDCCITDSTPPVRSPPLGAYCAECANTPYSTRNSGTGLYPLNK